MADYDNTNSGVFFQPRDNQTLSGQGVLNINGRDGNIAIIREPIKRDGEPQLVVYRKIGVLFPNDKSDNERAPQFSGPIDDNLRLAAWPGEKDGRRYMSLKLSQREQQGNGGGNQGGQGNGNGWGAAGNSAPHHEQSSQPPAGLNDEIPF